MTDNEIEILLVEDSPDDVEFTLHALRRNNLAHRVRVARDGEEALDYLFGSGTDRGQALGRSLKLVLLDLKLPKVDGLEVLRTIKGDPRTRAIPVVVLTSSKEENDLVNGYQLGANSYIQKPMDFERFCATVNTLSLYWLQLNRLPPARAFSA